jgi:hypothetical protein
MSLTGRLALKCLTMCFFSIILFTRGAVRIIMVLCWSAIVGPKILTYLPLWLLGVATYEASSRLRLSSYLGAAVGLILIALSAAIYAGVHGTVTRAGMFEPIGWIDLAISAAYFHLIGLIVFAVILGFSLISNKFPDNIFPRPVQAAIKWLAGGSFTQCAAPEGTSDYLDFRLK